jgi:hypothetical protein
VAPALVQLIVVGVDALWMSHVLMFGRRTVSDNPHLPENPWRIRRSSL